MSPKARSMDYLRKQGWCVADVEKWNSFARVRQDAWGFCDLICFSSLHPGVTAIQVTSDTNRSHRRQKLEQMDEVRRFKLCSNRVLLHSWGKRGLRGKRKVWTLTEEAL